MTMKTESHHSKHLMLEDIFSQISEVGSYIRSTGRPAAGQGYHHHSFAYVFEPANRTDKAAYHRHVKLMAMIHDILNECCINIKSRGYTYIRDAVCLITDHDTFDVCMNKDIYPHIASKHNISGVSRVEHNIRNSINAAYHLCRAKGIAEDTLMGRFDSKPTPKEFLLHLTHEVDRRLCGELAAVEF